MSGTLGDAPEAASLAYLGGGLLLAHAPGFDLGAARWALHRYDRTALGDSGGAPRALRSLGSGTWTGPRDTLQYTYVGAERAQPPRGEPDHVPVSPAEARPPRRRASTGAARCTSCPSSASSAPAVGFSEPIAADVRGGLLDSGSLSLRAVLGQLPALRPRRMRLVRVGRRALARVRRWRLLLRLRHVAVGVDRVR